MDLPSAGRAGTWRKYVLPAASGIFSALCLVQIALAQGGSQGPLFRQTESDSLDRRVALVQHVLADRELYSCMVDGLFGARTTSAVKSFQTAQGLKVDGIVGPETGKAMGLPFWDTHLVRRLDTPFRDAKYPQGNEFNFRSLTEAGNFFSGQPDAQYSSSDTLTRRALRTNNPGAINISKWQRDSMKGYVGTTLPGPDGNVTTVYETPEQGVAAWGFLIRKIYFNGKKEKVTVGEIVDKYRGTNSRTPYIDGYKKYSDGKLTEDYEIDLYDNAELARLAIAAYSHELGFWYPLTEKQLLAGLAITDGYIDSGVTDEVTVSPEEFDPGLYLKQPDAEKKEPGKCPGGL
ncbi:peptidoglycan-binding domain-containing protein [Taklimakanibacter deserti]|uniref:peptidoglycan-binding domain-containing protein n=1 Tax=Taklimakanibacter deserti TaxID=2267839 RepID=UPI000E64A745